MNDHTQQPLVLVDIDGVLNAFAARGTAPHRRSARAGGMPVVLDRRHPHWFERLETYAELRWASMWQAHAAPVFGSTAGIGTHWDFLDFDASWAWTPSQVGRTGDGVGAYKWWEILRCSRGGRPLVWIDDDMTDDHLAWAEQRATAGTPTLFLRPDPREGFTESQFEQVLTFVRRHDVRLPRSTSA